MNATEILNSMRKARSSAREARRAGHIQKTRDTLHRMQCRRYLPGYREAERLNAIENPFNAVAAALK